MLYKSQINILIYGLIIIIYFKFPTYEKKMDSLNKFHIFKFNMQKKTHPIDQ